MTSALDRKRNASHVATVAMCLLLLGWASPSPASATAVLGQTGTMDVLVDGSPVPSGTTLLSPTVLETRSQPARVFLSRGQILELARDTKAHLEATPRGELEVAVDGGAVAVHSGEGEPVTAVASQRLVFVQPQVQIAQVGAPSAAARILPIVALTAGGCTVSAEDPTQCVAVSGDDSCAENDGTCECTKMDPSGVCEECECDAAAAVPPPAGGGLSTGAKVGIGLGAAAGVVLIVNELDDDPPASPVN